MDKTIQFHIQFQIVQYTFMLMLETKIWYSIANMRMLNALISRIYFKPHARVASLTFALPRNYDFSLCIKTYQWNIPTRQSLRVVIDILFIAANCWDVVGFSFISHPSLIPQAIFEFLSMDVKQMCFGAMVKPITNHNGNRILILHWTRH